jgi:hypothetical protein
LFYPSSCEHQPGGSGVDKRFQAAVSQSTGRSLDVLFITEDANVFGHDWHFCMVGESFWALPIDVWQKLDLHIGGITTDLGAGEYREGGCEDVHGDRGVLGMQSGDDIAGLCLGTDHRYLVSISPQGCEIEKSASGECERNSCEQMHCDAIANDNEKLELLINYYNCPRCVNYDLQSSAGSNVDFLTGCMAVTGNTCIFPQPLEAMYQALNDNSLNTGFLRDDAYLLIVFIMKHDDCSASDPILFDPSQNSLDAPLGYFSGFRCFEFGVTCDTDDRAHIGVRHNCRPRIDPDALLYPISRYVEFIHSIKDPQLVTVATLAAPMDGQKVIVGRDEEGRPEIQSECGHPGIRLQAFANAFQSPQERQWARGLVCPECADAFMHTLGAGMLDKILQASCFPQPLDGCADVGVAYGNPQSDQTCAINNQCLPACEVVDVSWRGTQQERRRAIPHCLEIGLDGTVLTGNTDRSLAYADGRPAERDPALPVATCWFVGYDPNCETSNRAALVVSRRNDPPPRTFAEVSCLGIEATETQCADGVDNDQDCLIDSEDPDC